MGDRVEARLGRRRTLWLGIGGLAGGSTLLCLSAAPWASISACFLMGALGGLLPAIVPAVLADSEVRHHVSGIRYQMERSHASDF